jgi:hypothetical protein
LPSIEILTWGVSSFPLGLYLPKSSQEDNTPLSLFTQRIL